MDMNFDPFGGMLGSMANGELLITLVANHAKRVTPVNIHNSRTVEIISNIEVNGRTQEISLWVQKRPSDMIFGGKYLHYCLLYGHPEQWECEMFNQIHSPLPLTPCSGDDDFNGASFYIGYETSYIGGHEDVPKVMELLGAIRTYIESNYGELFNMGLRFR